MRPFGRLNIEHDLELLWLSRK
jgi:hypothetical protein